MAKGADIVIMWGKFRTFGIGAVALGIAWLPATADALLILDVGTNYGSATIEDGGAYDLDDLEGSVTFAGLLGGYSLNITTGISKPLAGTETSPEQALWSVYISGGTDNQLQISLTDTDYSLSTPMATVDAWASGYSTGLVSFASYLSPSNDPFATDYLLASFESLGYAGSGQSSFDQSYSGLTNEPSLSGGPISMTSVLSISHYGGGITLFDSYVSVSEAAALWLFASGLLGFSLFQLRKQRRLRLNRLTS